MGVPFGLGAVASNGELVFLPLDSVFVDAYIFDVSALVSITQQYRTPSRDDHHDLTAARYLFPIPEGASVCSFKMELSDGSVVSGVVKEAEEAKQIFQDAVTQGSWAGLAYEITADVFAISVGAIPAGQGVKVELTYATTVPDDESDLLNQIRFAIPTFIGQRYGDAPSELSQGRSSDQSATLSFKGTIQLTSKIIGVLSPSHAIDVEPSKRIQSKPATLYSTTVRLRDPAPSDRDFILSIQAEKLDEPRCVAEVDEDARTVALSLTMIPRFAAPFVQKQEYVFLIDRSGSMGAHNCIDYAKDALHHLIKSLPAEDTYFNIVSFGSNFSTFLDMSIAYNSHSVKQAAKHIDSMSADMGGTEIGRALGFVFKNRKPTIPIAVVVLTDGYVWRPDEAITIVRTAVQGASTDAFVRVFSLGIGTGASSALCEGIARAGNGVCYMGTQSEDIKERSSRLLLAARTVPYGSASAIKIDWGYDSVPRAKAPSAKTTQNAQAQKPVNLFSKRYNPLAAAKRDVGPKFVLPPPPGVLQAPPRVPNLYPTNRFLVSAILTDTTEIPKVVKLSGTLPDGTAVQLPRIKVAYTVAKTDERPPLLHTLAAHRIVRTLEDGDLSAFGLNDYGNRGLHDEMVKAEVVAYGTRYSLATRFTSFIAVRDADLEDNDQSDDSDESTDSDSSDEGSLPLEGEGDEAEDGIEGEEDESGEEDKGDEHEGDEEDKDGGVTNSDIEEHRSMRVGQQPEMSLESEPIATPSAQAAPECPAESAKTPMVAEHFMTSTSAKAAPDSQCPSLDAAIIEQDLVHASRPLEHITPTSVSGHCDNTVVYSDATPVLSCLPLDAPMAEQNSPVRLPSRLSSQDMVPFSAPTCNSNLTTRPPAVEVAPASASVSLVSPRTESALPAPGPLTSPQDNAALSAPVSMTGLPCFEAAPVYVPMPMHPDMPSETSPTTVKAVDQSEHAVVQGLPCTSELTTQMQPCKESTPSVPIMVMSIPTSRQSTPPREPGIVSMPWSREAPPSPEPVIVSTLPSGPPSGPCIASMLSSREPSPPPGPSIVSALSSMPASPSPKPSIASALSSSPATPPHKPTAVPMLPRLIARTPPCSERIMVANKRVVVVSSEDVKAGSDSVTAVTHLQQHDGSFTLDNKLVSLLQRGNQSLTLDKLKDTLPESLRQTVRGACNASMQDVEAVWATVLATAYMFVALRDKRSVWEGLWEKARHFVCGEMHVAPIMFNQLVQTASEMLQ